MSTTKMSGCNNRPETFANTASMVFSYLTETLIMINFAVIGTLLKFDLSSNTFLMLAGASLVHFVISVVSGNITFKENKAFDFAANILLAVCCGIILYCHKSYMSMSIFLTSIVAVSLRMPLLKSSILSSLYYIAFILSLKYGSDENFNTLFTGMGAMLLFCAAVYICHCFSNIESKKIGQDETIIGLLDEKIKLTHKLASKDEKLKEAYWDMVETLMGVIEARDNFTGGHSVKVCEYSVKLAKKIGLSDDEISNIMKASILHDIGKMGIPDNILLKPGSLSKDEYNTIMTHPEIGCSILSRVRGLEDILPLILYHHERVDGTGYPYGLRGDKIPIGARIIAIADAYDAMTSNRPYRKALVKKEAKKRLLEASGTQFDPELVNKFMEIIEEDNIDSMNNYRHVDEIKKHVGIG
jgi:hypothetical protein